MCVNCCGYSSQCLITGCVGQCKYYVTLTLHHRWTLMDTFVQVYIVTDVFKIQMLMYYLDNICLSPCIITFGFTAQHAVQ